METKKWKLNNGTLDIADINIQKADDLAKLLSLADIYTYLAGSGDSDEYILKVELGDLLKKIDNKYGRTIELPSGQIGTASAYLMEMQRYFVVNDFYEEKCEYSQVFSVSPINDKQEDDIFMCYKRALRYRNSLDYNDYYHIPSRNGFGSVSNVLDLKNQRAIHSLNIYSEQKNDLEQLTGLLDSITLTSDLDIKHRKLVEAKEMARDINSKYQWTILLPNMQYHFGNVLAWLFAMGRYDNVITLFDIVDTTDYIAFSSFFTSTSFRNYNYNKVYDFFSYFAEISSLDPICEDLWYQELVSKYSSEDCAVLLEKRRKAKKMLQFYYNQKLELNKQSVKNDHLSSSIVKVEKEKVNVLGYLKNKIKNTFC